MVENVGSIVVVVEFGRVSITENVGYNISIINKLIEVEQFSEI